MKNTLMKLPTVTKKEWISIMINELELLDLRFVRSVRVGDFELFVQSLQEIADLRHALDQRHYALWLPVHVKDMVELPRKHPEVYRQFMDGKFVVQRSTNRFSGMGKDQSHEQSVKLIIFRFWYSKHI